MLELKNICFSYDNGFALEDISFSLSKNNIIGLVGPNGSGKTSLFRVIDNFVKTGSGQILIDGKDISFKSRKEIAKQIAFVPQLSQPPEGVSVFEMVSFGRYPYLDIFQNETVKDIEIVKNAMDEVGISGFSGRDVSTLSGGEYQRVIIARALAQEAKILLLDEPVSHLDIKYQIEIMDLLKNIKKDKLIIATLHDLRLAAYYSDEILLLSKGRLFAKGYPSNILSPDNISNVFGLKQEKVLQMGNILIK